MPVASASGLRVGWLFAELIVVFVGVYAAFFLEGCRRDARDDERRAHIVATIDEEAAVTIDHLDRVLPAFDSTAYQPFMEAYQRGGRPALRPLNYYSPGARIERWQAMLAAGGVEVLDVEVINAAQDFYDAAREVRDVVTEARSMSNQYLVPALGSEDAHFYTGENTLRPRYRWYPMMLHQIRANVRKLREAATTLRGVLQP